MKKGISPKYFLRRLNASLIKATLAFFLCFSLAQLNDLMAQSRVDQLTDDQVQQFFDRAQRSGLTESQIEQMAISQGYSQIDIVKMRERLAKLQSSGGAKRGGGGGANNKNFDGIDTTGAGVRKQLGKLSIKDESPVKEDTKKSVVFGASLFKNPAQIFEPNLQIATPKGYQLGPGDELNVVIYGNSQETFKLKVSPEGTVQINNLAPVFVSGLSIEDARERITARLRREYSGLGVSGSYAQITLGNIRSIKVTVTGEATRPGTYTVSSFASVFNALYLAGGPSENGSYRQITVVRDNRVVRTVDLYDFLLRADEKDNIRLRDQDVIRIADYGDRVEFVGQVKRPAIYEIKPTETLKTLLGFAGGFTDKAYRFGITLRRNTEKELRLANVTQAEFADFVPQAGDRYTVGSIISRYENRVQITGAVFRPGEYAIEAGTKTVKELIARAEGLREDAFRARGIIFRQRDDLENEQVAFDVAQLMGGQADDIPLKRLDSVSIKSVKELRERYTVGISGAVNEPSDSLEYASNMSVADLIMMAGGFSDAAAPSKIEISRRIRSGSTVDENQKAQIIELGISADLKLSPQDASYVLQPFDIVYVRTTPRYEVQRQVTALGEVKYPGSYTIETKAERISNLIARAGKPTEEAYLHGARFLRKGQSVGIDIASIITNPTQPANLLLESGDTLLVPKKSETVKLVGGLLNPNSVAFEPTYKFQDYVARAGGYTDNARRSKAFITYANGLTDRTRKFLFFNVSPKVEPGSTIFVPFKISDGSGLTTGERISIFSTLTTLLIVTASLLRR